MKTFVKYLVLTLLFAVSAFALVSCGGEDVVLATTEAVFEGKVLFDGNDEISIKAADDFIYELDSRGLGRKTAYAYSVMSGDVEIIFGSSDREASIKAVERLNAETAKSPDDLHWCFCYSDGKLAIAANSKIAYERAIRELFGTYFKDASLVVNSLLFESGSLTLADYEAQFKREKNQAFDEGGLINSAELPNLGTKYDAGQDSSLFIMKNVRIWEFTELCSDIEAHGFKYYTGNVIGKNVFATYVTETQILHTMFFYNTSEIRTAVDKRGEGTDGFSLAGLSGDNDYETEGESLMTFVAIDNEGWDWPGGLCMIFKLADGRFFIIDAGQNGTASRASSSEWIYATLAKHADDPNNIEVAAWLVTHIHGDHYGGLLDLARGQYKASDGNHTVMPEGVTDKIKIDTLIYNQPADIAGVITDSGKITEIIEAFDIKKVVKAHPGHEFFISDLTLTIYGTQDLIVEQNDTVTNHNEHSIVTMIDFNGKRLLSLADSFPKHNKQIASIYKQDLKADVIQTAHHGYTDTGAKSVNNYCNPDIVLWSNSVAAIEKNKLKSKDINANFVGKVNYALDGGNIDFDSSWTASEPYSVADMIPDCSCGCGMNSTDR